MSSSSSQIIPFSSTSSSTFTHDVFLSFYSQDTTDFTDDLVNALRDKSIRTYMDESDVIGKGVKLIRESKICIVVLSENYAFSTRCLDQLVEIIKCFKEFDRLVIPIYYKIHPAVVGYQAGSFQTAFQEHEIHFAGEMEKVNSWRHGLQEVAKLSGFHFSEISSEVDILKQVVERILLEIKPRTLPVPKYTVGLDSRIKDIISLLNMSGDKDLTIIGIYGMGGIGKTTVAKAVYNEISPNFMGGSFLENVREVSGRVMGLVSLQQQLIDDVLKEKIYTVHNVSEGTAIIKEIICSIKFLVIIDDLENLVQFESLVGPFVSGSVIIITTRNQDLLAQIGVEYTHQYMLKELDNAESWQLFKKHARGDETSYDAFRNKYLYREILDHAGGLPLALEVFGSSLHNQSWKCRKQFVGHFKETIDPYIMRKLTISFDALGSPLPKEMFLDIACFFVGKKRKYVILILRSCYSDVESHINYLKSRCLLTIDEDDRVSMHGLIRNMGWEIARKGFETEKHSRVVGGKDTIGGKKIVGGKDNVYIVGEKDLNVVLSEKEGSEAIKGMVHHRSDHLYLQIDTEIFRRMPNLRFLKISRVHIRGSFKQTFKELRWLHWFYCPLDSLPSSFCPEKLVVLELPCSTIRRWDLRKDLISLKILDLSNSLNLRETPKFSKLPHLETINLRWCVRLKKVDTTIGLLHDLVSLNLAFCTDLRILPDSVCNLRALRILNIGDCYKLKALPAKLGNLESLIELNMKGCRSLRSLPDSVCNLRALQSLNIEGCWKLLNLQLPANLVKLSARDNSSLLIIKDLSNLKHLKTLYISTCPRLREIVGLDKVVSLRYLDLHNCSMERLPNLSRLQQLEMFVITNCYRLIEIEGLKELTSLRQLCLTGCKSSMVANTLTEGFIQLYAQFGNEIEIRLDRHDTPMWIGHSGWRVRTEVLTNVSDKLSGLLLTLSCDGGLRDSHRCSYTIETRTTGLRIISSDYDSGKFDDKETLMVIVPIKDLVKSCGSYGKDTIFKVTASCKHHDGEVNIQVLPLRKPHRRHDRSEFDITNNVVDTVSSAISSIVNVAKYPVGIDSHVRQITPMLTSGSQGLHYIGIWGMGGVGKTTLAKAVYSANFGSFESSCFLANVTEVSGLPNGPQTLQAQLIADVLKVQKYTIDSVDKGMELINQRICSAKVLVVLDDVNDPKQVDMLVGQFSSGSVIILTTRHEDLLAKVGVESRYRYMLNQLGHAQSRELFMKHAIGDTKPSGRFSELSENFVSYVGGLPLALVVFGSNLSNQPEVGWRYILKNLHQIPDSNIQEKLMVSFDALKLEDPMLMNMFIDIACFFIREDKEDAVKMMETCYTLADCKINILENRCLITINKENKLEMHEKLQDMVWQIVSNKSLTEPGKRSRLWDWKDICDVLKKNKGTKVFDGTISHDSSYYNAFYGVSLTTEVFRSMHKLRFLYLSDVNLTGSFEGTLEDLRWLYWSECPLKSLPSEFCLQNLVILELPHSKMSRWDLTMVLQNLKILDVSHSSELTETSYFILLPSLRTLILHSCVSLTHVHESVGSLVKLVSLDLSSCTKLESLPDSMSNLSSLKILNLLGCSSLEALPTGLTNIELLTDIRATEFSISELPNSKGDLSKFLSLFSGQT